MITARSTPNIALIKYWGNRHEEFRLCAGESTSMTLDGPYVDVTVDYADTLHVTSSNKVMTAESVVRFQKTLELIQAYLTTIDNCDVTNLSIDIQSHIPPSIGLASSAAVFSGLAKAIAGLVEIPLTDEQISVMARLGSGSASRSIFGGYGAIRNEENMFIDGSKGWQIADENHWKLHDIIIVPSTEEKKVGSTEGHANAETSPHYKQRLSDIAKRRQKECIDAIAHKDFEHLQTVAEQDAMNMHLCMQTQTPELNYLSDETHRIITEIQEIRTSEHLPVLYTMDAGPTVHLFCEEEAKERILSYANEQEGCQIFEASTGSGAHLI
ncbi:diphosphomevalonate decarboxylase [Candidatus Peregrinibacteria bacterium]|jgi:diphosphomevalonate decarboxylase|nr:diphosphomevalonate decarboxylase [Candidatus Peregrinibacteria bacterium]MBT5468878.1 diphosphomevalonate decarboxylase [Candidatus Peregrinibacteria bacterium]MBT7337422.1 diphosphomevalonate decarboxylase [Candidatus Peregrinibacteria bacterium]